MNISLAPEIIFYIGGFGVTNTLFWSFFISLFLVLITFILRVSIKTIPGRFQNFIEVLLEGSLDFINNITGDKKKTKILFPLIVTLFVFILTANLFTFIPGQAALTINKGEGGVPLFRAVMSDYGMVFVLTCISVIIIQIVSIIAVGPFGYLTKFINFKKIFKARSISDFLYGLLDVFLGIMDFIGELAKVLSLSFRLFGNMFAGEVLTAVMLFLMPFIAPLPFMFLGLITAVIQAFVFSVLTLVFISMASEMKLEES